MVNTQHAGVDQTPRRFSSHNHAGNRQERSVIAAIAPKLAAELYGLQIVEDRVEDRRLLVDYLRSLGHRLYAADNGRDGFELARALEPDLIIMDIQLPNVSGLDLIEAAKKDATLRTIPVLAVTAYAGKGDEERIREAGAEGYLAKPVSIAPFMVAVRGLV